MSCTKHVLGIEFERHAWERRVTHAENWSARGTDMWSRAVPVEQTLCQIQFVCRDCGAVREGGDCTCDRERADACPPRLAWLAEARGVQEAKTPSVA